MPIKTTLVFLVSLLALSSAACGTDRGDGDAPDRELALGQLQREAGAPVALEVNEAGTTRVLAMTPRFPVPGRRHDPAEAAQAFVVDHRDVFQLGAIDASSFAVGRVDIDPTSGLRHVTLQRTHAGIPVFQGAITVHMDADNNVFRVLGDEFYRAGAPSNRWMLTPAEAAIAAGKALGVSLAPQIVAQDGPRTRFAAAGTLDPIDVEPQIFQVTAGDARFAYQTTVSWLGDDKQQRYELALVDAQDGSLLAHHSLINTFYGRVFTRSPGAAPVVDGRKLVSFNGDPVASPSGWVDAMRRTRGNNAVAATDLDGNNVVTFPTEIQPTASMTGGFDFPFSAATSAGGFREAAATTAFFLVNDFHDRTYKLGFTETAGNFQTSNFGKGGAQNDEVQVDVQDGGGGNNATFATPPDGSRPRMQMFMFNLVSGSPQQDGDFDPSVIYHENSHGLSNRLVGGGSTACLGGIQSGGMGEGWGDFLGASFLNDPVVGAYVTGNATVGIRRASMASSPFTYTNIQNGTMTEVHDAGEVWAAALWTARATIGAATIERLVVQGMKLTPCNPTMLQARDAILSADQMLNGGANRCRLWTAFASRQMGTGASSPNNNSTSAIITSAAVPPECTGLTQTFASTDVPKTIPDDTPSGATSAINIGLIGLDIQQVKVDVDITHTFRGDLVIQVISPDGHTAMLSGREGGAAANFLASGLDITSAFPAGSPATGTWKLFVRDLAAADVGTINAFRLTIKSSKWSASAAPGLATVDNGTACTNLTVATTGDSSLAKLDISGVHSFRSVLRGTLAHNGATVAAFPVGTFSAGTGTFSFVNRPVPGLSGNAQGTWTLCIVDTDAFGDTGTLNSWSVHD